MMSAIPPINPSMVASTSAQSPNATKPAGFGNLFQQLLSQTNNEQHVADNAIQDFVENKNTNIQQVVMAVAQAEMSFQFFMEVRNQLIDSYSELMRMQF